MAVAAPEKDLLFFLGEHFLPQKPSYGPGLGLGPHQFHRPLVHLPCQAPLLPHHIGAGHQLIDPVAHMGQSQTAQAQQFFF